MTITITFEHVKGGDAIAAWDRKGLRVKSGGFGNASRGQSQSPHADQGRICVSSLTSSPKIGVLASEEGSVHSQYTASRVPRQRGAASGSLCRGNGALTIIKSTVEARLCSTPHRRGQNVTLECYQWSRFRGWIRKCSSFCTTSKCTKSNKQSALTK